MANTYTQLYVQIVFGVKGRQNLISEEIREKVEKYMCGIVSHNKAKALAIYCNPDHVHILISLHPSVSISEITRDIKSSSSKWINENNWIPQKFNWQEGFGAFTYSKSAINNVKNYILNQAEHHKKSTFKEEYIKLLEDFDIEYDVKYLFKWNE
jgi:putative transposase